MSDEEISQVLAQMRVVAARAQGIPSMGQVNETRKSDFADILKKSVNAVNDTQQHAGNMTEAFQAGDPNVDITQVMVALQKASVSFQAMTQVRNKLVDAYQEIMRMQI